MADVFISYARARSAEAAELASKLTHLGYDVWTDVLIRPTGSFGAEIDRQLDAARAVIVIWSPEALRSKWVRSEASHGDRQDKLVNTHTADPGVVTGIPKPLDLIHSVGIEDIRAIVGALDQLSVPRSSGSTVQRGPLPTPRQKGLVSLDECQREPGTGKLRWVKDLDTGPEMVVVPGDPAFAIGRFTVTFAEWDAAQAHPDWRKHAEIAPRKPKDFGWGRGQQPVIDVSWEDASVYCRWLSAVTGKAYRLPSEVEWEHACRAGTETAFWWGDEISTEQANYNGKYTFRHGSKGEYRGQPVSVERFEANPWGLYQMHGNVWEWCEDAYDASDRVLRGGSWVIDPVALRSSARYGKSPVYRYYNVGFRVVRAL